MQILKEKKDLMVKEDVALEKAKTDLGGTDNTDMSNIGHGSWNKMTI